MLVADGGGIPLGALVESAQKAEVELANATLATVKVSRPRGRPRSRPKEAVADKGYDSDSLRRTWRKRGIKPCIPRRRNRKPRRGRKPNLEGYCHRWIVERTFSWLGNFRRLVVRWERHTLNYLAFLFIACAIICLRSISG
jgi:transposase